MRTGEPAQLRAGGFTYLWLLFVIAIGGAGLAVLGQRWQTVIQRDREFEMTFRAQQIVDAISRYQARSPQGAASLPKELDQLLDDRRSGASLRHLRRLYADPFTGAADWVLLRNADGGIVGLHSAARVPAFVTRDLPARASGERARVVTVADRAFMAGLPRGRPAASAPPPAADASAPEPSGQVRE